ncbi:hypothetical protein DPX39_010042400 [Trypanosoma brucei equiperdum]|uniref:PDZ domain-containing protein n=1 Tax=Trypanosoma brucei equiperdum TaxID=630700 RepID=A0A3L6LE70_9TRYP|nr:hypothetical protein DPX39_010042400 [Trypanosoma brucei equiperdum]
MEKVATTASTAALRRGINKKEKEKGEVVDGGSARRKKGINAVEGGQSLGDSEARQRQLLLSRKDAVTPIPEVALRMFNIAIEDLCNKYLQDYYTAAGNLFLVHSRRLSPQTNGPRSSQQVQSQRHPEKVIQKISSVPVKTASSERPSQAPSRGCSTSFRSSRLSAGTAGAATITRSSQSIPLSIRRPTSLLSSSKVVQSRKDRSTCQGGTGTTEDINHTSASRNKASRTEFMDARTTAVSDERQRSRLFTMCSGTTSPSAGNSSRRWTAAGAEANQTHPSGASKTSANSPASPVPRIPISKVWKASVSSRTADKQLESPGRLTEPLRTRLYATDAEVSPEHRRQTSPSLLSRKHRESRASATPAKPEPPLNESSRHPRASSATTPRMSRVSASSTPQFSRRSLVTTPRVPHRASVRRAGESPHTSVSRLTTPRQLRPCTHCRGRGIEGGIIGLVSSTRSADLAKESVDCSTEYRLEWSCTNSCAQSYTQQTSSQRRSTALVGPNRSTLTGVFEWPVGRHTPLSRPYSQTAVPRGSITRDGGCPTTDVTPPSPLVRSLTLISESVNETPAEYISRHFSSCVINSVLECVRVKMGGRKSDEADPRADELNGSDSSDDTDKIGNGDATNDISLGLQKGDLLLECNGQPLSGAASLQEIIRKALLCDNNTVLLRVLRGADSIAVRETLLKDSSAVTIVEPVM